MSATGSFKNFNTIEDFKNADKNALFNGVADEIWKSIVDDKSTKMLNRFLVITFADLKKYKYFYWFAFPAFAAKPAWEIDGEWAVAEDLLGKDAVRNSFNRHPLHVGTQAHIYGTLQPAMLGEQARISLSLLVAGRASSVAEIEYDISRDQVQHL